MSIRDEFAAYTNVDGFVSSHKSGSSGNDLLFSSEAAVIRRKLGAWDRSDEAKLNAAIANHAQIEPGLYGRPAWNQDQEQPDDYYGLVALSPFYARAIRAYGQRHFWSFKTSSAAKWYEPMFWRFPALICHAAWGAGEKPNAFLRLWWAASVAFSGSKTSQDPWILSWLLTEVAGDKGWLERLATRIYLFRLKAACGSLRAVFAAYFQDADHPISKYSPI